MKSLLLVMVLLFSTLVPVMAQDDEKKVLMINGIGEVQLHEKQDVEVVLTIVAIVLMIISNVCYVLLKRLYINRKMYINNDIIALVFAYVSIVAFLSATFSISVASAAFFASVAVATASVVSATMTIIATASGVIIVIITIITPYFLIKKNIYLVSSLVFYIFMAITMFV